MARTNHLRGLVVMAAVALAAGLLVLVAAGRPAQASFPGANGLIAFVSDRHGNDEIYVMDRDGGNPTRLTTDPAIDNDPAVSPNGKEIAFVSNRDHPGSFAGDIYVMDAKDNDGNDEGDNLRRLTNNATSDLFGHPPNPAWSPDGKTIAFRSNQDGNDEVYMMPTDGSQTPTPLTNNPKDDGSPVFSPDVNNPKIAFQSFRDGNSEIYVMKPEPESATNVPLNLTNTKPVPGVQGGFDSHPEFSPDGTQIAFTSNRRLNPNGTTNYDIWVMNAKDGSNPTNLTNSASTVRDIWPAWSPDGTKIAFWKGENVNGADGDIWVMDAKDGSNPTNLTDNNPPAGCNSNPPSNPSICVGDIQPNWGPDTTKPEITLRTPAEGDTYTLNQSVTADSECADEGGSGLASCEGDVPDGASIDTSSVGDKTFTVTAKDNGGNTNSVTHNYRVVYDFKGFFDPVDNPPTLNSAKAGSAIPVKFSLSGDQGLDVLAEGYPKSQEISCDSAAQVNGVEETATANESGLTYDASTDEYTYVWKTDKAWAGTCRQLVVKLKDGTEYKANFKLR